MRRFPTSSLRQFGAVLLIGLGAAQASAQPKPENPEAKVHLDRGLALYQSKEYAAAADELAQAYKMSPNPDLLYALAQARRLTGDCPAAVPLYRKFLDDGPPAKEAELARKNLARCEEDARSTPTATAPASAPVAPAPAAPTAPPTPVSPTSGAAGAEPLPTPWYADLAGDLLLGGAVAGYGAASGLYLASRSELDTAAGASRYDDVSRHVDRAGWDRTGAWIAGAAASGLLVAAILRLTLRGPAHPARVAPTTAVAFSPATVVLRF